MPLPGAPGPGVPVSRILHQRHRIDAGLRSMAGSPSGETGNACPAAGDRPLKGHPQAGRTPALRRQQAVARQDG